jgi:hypothetical protein
MQRREPVRGRTEDLNPRKVRAVIRMQISQEDLVHLREGNLHDVVVDPAARPGVQHKRLSVAELDVDAGALLVGPDHVHQPVPIKVTRIWSGPSCSPG